MLLSSPSFSDFLGRLSSNPQQTMPLLPRPSQQQPQQTAEPGQRPKDVNPYASQQAQQHQIGMAMIPEQNMDFSTRSLNGESGASFFQPQVYAVLETPEFPIAPVDVSALAGKSSNLVGEQFNDKDAKADTPTVKGCPTPVETKPAGEQNDRAVDQPVDDAFENDPAFALWHTAPVDETETSTTSPRSEHVAASPGNFFGSIEPEKAWARYDLVDAATRERNEKVSMAVAMSRLHQITAKLDRMAFLLDSLVEDC